MAFTLLRPHLLSFKNEVRKEWFAKKINRTTFAILLSSFVIAGIYGGAVSFLERLRFHPQFTPGILEHIFYLALFSFSVLLFVSALVAGLSHLYHSKELSLVLMTPVSMRELFTAKLLQTTISSSWMFFLLLITAIIAACSAFEISRITILETILCLIPFALIQSSLALIIIVLVVRIIPAARLREAIVASVFLGLCFVLTLERKETPPVLRASSVETAVEALSGRPAEHAVYLPSRWAGDILLKRFGIPRDEIWLSWLLLYGTATGLAALSYLFFEHFFMSGWTHATHKVTRLRVYQSSFLESFGNVLNSWPQARAIFAKELRTFSRDPTQSLQLLLLLTLTFIYLYNFRSLSSPADFGGELAHWWEVILSLANICFGGCVVSAIATRFVYPSVSLEGSSYTILRTSPLSIPQILKYKFFTWLIPVTIVALVLLISGSLAAQANLGTILATALVAVSLSIGFVGLGIGLGAYFAKFDWDSLAQITASIGSLLFMFLSMAALTCSLIPAFFLFILTAVPNFSAAMGTRDFFIAICCCSFLVFYIQYLVARRALTLGAEKLLALEQ